MKGVIIFLSGVIIGAMLMLAVAAIVIERRAQAEQPLTDTTLVNHSHIPDK